MGGNKNNCLPKKSSLSQNVILTTGQRVSESGGGAGNASLLIESGVLFSKKGAYAMGSGSLGLAVCRSLVVEAS